LTRKQAGLFSAAASAFMVDIQQELRQDYNETNPVALTVLLNTASEVPNQFGVPVPSGPQASAFQDQSILLIPLASALEMERVRRKVDSQYSWSFAEDIFKSRERYEMLRFACRKLIAVKDQVSY